MLPYGHLGQKVEQLPYGRRGFEVFAGALVAAAPAHQEMLPRRQHSLKQHITVLIATVGIPQQALLLHQVEARPLPLAWKGSCIESHQHHHLVGNGTHRFEGADGEGTGAMAEAPTAFAQALRQHFAHHGRGHRQGTVAGDRLPIAEGGMEGLQFPGPGAAVTKEGGELVAQPLNPGVHRATGAQPAEAAQELPQQRDPATLLIKASAQGHRGRGARGQAWRVGQHQPQQHAIDGPAEAVGGIAIPIACIQPPAEAGVLQGLGDRFGVGVVELMGAEQRFVGQQALQSRGGEPFSAKGQQLQHRLAEARFTLLAAIREAPWQLHPRRFTVAKHSSDQRGKGLHLRCHHQDVAGFEAVVAGQQLEQLIADHLQLSQATWAGMPLQGTVVWLAGEFAGVVAVDQMVLKVLQQRRPALVVFGCSGRQEKQVLLPHASQLGFAASFQELLKFSSESAEPGFESWHAEQPISRQGIQGCVALLALPEIPAGSQQIELDAAHGREGLQHFHLHRGQAAQAEQPQGLFRAVVRCPALLQAADQLPGPQAEGETPEALMQLMHQLGLPQQWLG